jgi:hypothetical protein
LKILPQKPTASSDQYKSHDNYYSLHAFLHYPKFVN